MDCRHRAGRGAERFSLRPGAEGGSRTSTSADVDAIKRVLDSYVMSVNAADTRLAREVWAEREGVSFIHPLGHERGWPQIKANFYQKLMGGMFRSAR